MHNLIMEKLEKRGVHTYYDAWREIKAINEELYFFTVDNRVTVIGVVQDSLLTLCHASPKDTFIPQPVISSKENLGNPEVSRQMGLYSARWTVV